MPKHREKRVLPYSQEQLFALVADIERYDEFLPWCLKSRFKKKESENLVIAELVIGFKMFRERFVSRVHLENPERIYVDYLEGPMRHLSNEWKFTPKEDEPDKCIVEFFVEFEFKNPILQRMVGLLFSEAFRRMVSAFENRAKELYGSHGSSMSSL
jgi:coenzyme Q-binding protein COQ10